MKAISLAAFLLTAAFALLLAMQIWARIGARL